MVKQKKSEIKRQAAITNYPSPIKAQETHLPKEEKIKIIAESFRNIMEALGLDLTHESLAKTPNRIAKMYVNEVFTGLELDNFPEVGLFTEKCASDEGHHSMILTKTSFSSFCEHHFVPMIGTVYIGYIHHGALVGLSKLHRMVRYFAARPQLQERLTAQIADSLATVLQNDNIAVSVQARHFCVHSRGVKDESGITTTNYFSGDFRQDSGKREEFFRGIDRLAKQGTLSE